MADPLTVWAAPRPDDGLRALLQATVTRCRSGRGGECRPVGPAPLRALGARPFVGIGYAPAVRGTWAACVVRSVTKEADLVERPALVRCQVHRVTPASPSAIRWTSPPTARRWCASRMWETRRPYQPRADRLGARPPGGRAGLAVIYVNLGTTEALPGCLCTDRLYFARNLERSFWPAWTPSPTPRSDGTSARARNGGGGPLGGIVEAMAGLAARRRFCGTPTSTPATSSCDGGGPT